MCTISAIANISIDRFICQIILYAMIIGSMLQLIWLFQGKENMKPITIINIISRIISVLLIFIFVKNKSDIYAYTFFYSPCSVVLPQVSVYLVAYVILMALSIYRKSVYSLPLSSIPAPNTKNTQPSKPAASYQAYSMEPCKPRPIEVATRSMISIESLDLSTR